MPKRARPFNNSNLNIPQNLIDLGFEIPQVRRFLTADTNKKNLIQEIVDWLSTQTEKLKSFMIDSYTSKTMFTADNISILFSRIGNAYQAGFEILFANEKWFHHLIKAEVFTAESLSHIFTRLGVNFPLAFNGFKQHLALLIPFITSDIFTGENISAMLSYTAEEFPGAVLALSKYHQQIRELVLIKKQFLGKNISSILHKSGVNFKLALELFFANIPRINALAAQKVFETSSLPSILSCAGHRLPELLTALEQHFPTLTRLTNEGGFRATQLSTILSTLTTKLPATLTALTTHADLLIKMVTVDKHFNNATIYILLTNQRYRLPLVLAAINQHLLVLYALIDQKILTALQLVNILEKTEDKFVEALEAIAKNFDNLVIIVQKKILSSDNLASMLKNAATAVPLAIETISMKISEYTEALELNKNLEWVDTVLTGFVFENLVPNQPELASDVEEDDDDLEIEVQPAAKRMRNE